MLALLVALAGCGEMRQQLGIPDRLDCVTVNQGTDAHGQPILHTECEVVR